MVKIVEGNRTGKGARLSIGCSAAVFDGARRLLLTRRMDNGRWCLPSGRMEPGESAMEACAREVEEETGLRVAVGRLIGLYSSLHHIYEYADGNRYQVVGLHFEATPVGGGLRLSDETTEYGYFTHDEIAGMDVMETHRDRIADAFTTRPMEMEALRERARAIRRRYAERETAQYGRPWTAYEVALGFVGDVGDLAKLIPAVSGRRAIPGARDKLAHELADCLWSVFVLADLHDIDLEAAFLGTMDDLETVLQREG